MMQIPNRAGSAMAWAPNCMALAMAFAWCCACNGSASSSSSDVGVGGETATGGATTSGGATEATGQGGADGGSNASGGGSQANGQGGDDAGGSGALGGSSGSGASDGGAGGNTGGGGANAGSGGVSAASGGANGDCQPVLNQADLDTGLETCMDGSKRRRAALQCPTEKTSPTSPCNPGFGPPFCMSDAECTREPNGYCANAHNLTGYCGCFYGCQQDSDCDADSVCECGIVVGRCVPATCKTNADCGAGFGCAATVEGVAGAACVSVNPTVASRYACQTALDECTSNDDCPNDGNNPGVCLLDGDHRACGTACAMTP